MLATLSSNHLTGPSSFQALLTGIRRNLQYARAFLVSLDVSHLSLLQFTALVTKHMKQVETIAEICQVQDDLTLHEVTGECTEMLWSLLCFRVSLTGKQLQQQQQLKQQQQQLDIISTCMRWSKQRRPFNFH